MNHLLDTPTLTSPSPLAKFVYDEIRYGKKKSWRGIAPGQLDVKYGFVLVL
jgi:hypothetical protein